MSDKIKIYFDLLMKWNRHMNLTAIDDYESFLKKHVCDVEKIIPHINGATSLLDLGAGAGLPGILIKIKNPKLYIVLIEAKRKKVSFCDEAIRTLGLADILAVWGRAEDEGLMRGLGAFDVVVSQATWNLADYVRLASRYLDIGGICIAMKGSRWRDELSAADAAINESGLVHMKDVEYELSDKEMRCLIILRKQKNVH